MPIILGQDCHRIATFIDQHKPNSVAAGSEIPLKQGQYVVDSSFFEVKSVEELQLIIDTTVQNIKKLDFTGKQAAAAKLLLLQATSEGNGRIKVRWGLHETVDHPIRSAGKCKHFTLQVDPNDWHLYVNTDGKRVSFMSNGRGPDNLVCINKF